MTHREISPEMSPKSRIVSLLASSTEIVCALGLEDSLVGRSHECDTPPSVRRLPVCTEPKFRTDVASAEIDRQVKSILRLALSVYRVDAEKLQALAPTHIITQTQCEVCAVSLKDVEEAVKALVVSRPQIVALQPDALADVWADIERVADALGVAQRGRELVASLQARMAAIAQQSRALPRRRTVACIEWIAPLMASGNWMPELVAMAGGHNLFGEPGRHSATLAWLELTAADPEILLILPCGFDIARTRQEFPVLAQKPGWSELKAVGEGRVYLLDGNQYFNRPGPRLAESLEILAETIHPETFHFGHEGGGWEKA
jgi:iron complex transport system substrate-binding protein